MMIDLDIPTANPPATDTLLHWMQAGLTPAAAPTQLNTTSGPIRAFLLDNTTATADDAIAPYFGPNPPARIPLSHRYTQILVDTSGMGADGLRALREAAATIRGFNAAAVLEGAGLAGRVVAGNSFNVTNPGPALAVNNTGTGTGGSASGTGVGGGGAGQTVVPVPGAGVGLRPGSVLVGGVVAVGMVMLSL